MNFLELVKARYSARKYANRPVEAEKLDYIMECVRFAPSAVNFQPWRFRIVTDEAVLKALYSCYKTGMACYGSLYHSGLCGS